MREFLNLQGKRNPWTVRKTPKSPNFEITVEIENLVAKRYPKTYGTLF